MRSSPFALWFDWWRAEGWRARVGRDPSRTRSDGSKLELDANALRHTFATMLGAAGVAGEFVD